jgi:hypothetical protein
MKAREIAMEVLDLVDSLEHFPDVIFKLAKAHLELEAKYQALEKAALDTLEDLYLNTSTDMPAAWNDEISWYRSQLMSVIGRAARAHLKLKAQLTPDGARNE